VAERRRTTEAASPSASFRLVFRHPGFKALRPFCRCPVPAWCRSTPALKEDRVMKMRPGSWRVSVVAALLLVVSSLGIGANATSGTHVKASGL
jgi:hypothetical protein